MEKKGKKKIYWSMAKIEEEFFPSLYKERLEAEEKKDPSISGTGLAMELLNSIRQQLAE